MATPHLMKRSITPYAYAVAALILSASVPFLSAGDGKKPNVLLIAIDDLNDPPRAISADRVSAEKPLEESL